jgi:flagellar assembly protein FliH
MSAESSGSEQSPAKPAERFFYAPMNGETADSQPAQTAAAPRNVAEPAAQPRHSAPTETRNYETGLVEGEARARAAFEKALAEVRSQISVALREFTTQREQYFERVEAEVVQLTLSIARKILHRESQIDPLLLTGVVRVALEGLNDETHARLRANPDEVRFWRDYFSQASDIRPKPDVMGDPTLAVGHCVLETDLGSTHISFETQLKEIERGFLDLLDQRPRGHE